MLIPMEWRSCKIILWPIVEKFGMKFKKYTCRVRDFKVARVYAQLGQNVTEAVGT